MPRTLVIDDDPETEPLLRAHLAAFADDGDNDVVVARSDAEALTLLRSGVDFDIALIAIDREPISGLGVFKQITDRRLRIPRIAITSGSDLGLIRQAMNEGATDFLVKPFSGQDFAITVKRVLDDVERRRRNWRERAEFSALRREIDIAADIQRRILPAEFPAVDGMEVFAATEPAKVMGGDFFDVFPLNGAAGGPLGFVIADVSGKGVPAAFYMAVARTLLRSVATAGVRPADCLDQVNELLCDHHIPGMFVSAVYGVIEPASGRVTFANAGHQPPYIAGPGRAPEAVIGGGGTVLGVVNGLDFEQAAVDLAPGELLYLCTDGVTEAFNGDRDQFSEARLEACLAGLGAATADGVVAAVRRAVSEFTAGAEQNDDVTSLVIRRAG